MEDGMIKVKTINSVEKIKYVSIFMLTLYFLLYIMGFNFVTMDNTMLDEYEKVNISDYFKGDNISFYKFSSLEKEEFIVGKEVVENGASPPNPDTPLLYVDGYGVLMKACENYWVLFESENRMFEVLSRVIFIRTATTESCHCFNSVVGHSEILEFLQKNEPEPLGELSNDVVHSFFIPGIN